MNMKKQAAIIYLYIYILYYLNIFCYEPYGEGALW